MFQKRNFKWEGYFINVEIQKRGVGPEGLLSIYIERKYRNAGGGGVGVMLTNSGMPDVYFRDPCQILIHIDLSDDQFKFF